MGSEVLENLKLTLFSQRFFSLIYIQQNSLVLSQDSNVNKSKT